MLWASMSVCTALKRARLAARWKMKKWWYQKPSLLLLLLLYHIILRILSYYTLLHYIILYYIILYYIILYYIVLYYSITVYYINDYYSLVPNLWLKIIKSMVNQPTLGLVILSHSHMDSSVIPKTGDGKTCQPKCAICVCLKRRKVPQLENS